MKKIRIEGLLVNKKCQIIFGGLLLHRNRFKHHFILKSLFSPDDDNDDKKA